MSKEKIIQFLEEMIEALTFKRIALLSLLASITIAMLSVYENRTAVFAAMYKTAVIPATVKWDLSTESQDRLKELTRAGLIGALLLSDVDLKRNQRTIKFHYIKDSRAAEEAAIVLSKLIPQALFDIDSKNTDQMVSMLNNEFKCVPAKDTSMTRFLPNFTKYYSTVCRLAVPPFFGEFIGYITIILVRPPTEHEFDALKIELNRVAVDIYLRDITKKRL